MKNKTDIPDFSCVESMLREYGKNHNASPQQVMDIFHEGISAVAEKYPAYHPLHIAVMVGAYLPRTFKY